MTNLAIERQDDGDWITVIVGAEPPNNFCCVYVRKNFWRGLSPHWKPAEIHISSTYQAKYAFYADEAERYSEILAKAVEIARDLDAKCIDDPGK